MRKKLVIATALCAILMTGCATDVPDLSRVDSRKASEYMAGQLLKYDSNYDYGLDYDHAILDPTPTPQPTVSPTQTAKPKDDKTSQSSQASAASNIADGNADEETLQQVALSEIYGVKDTEVRFVSSSMKSSLGDDYAYFKAAKGKKLLLLYFRVKNTGAKDSKINLIAAKPQYQLVVDGVSTGELQQTIAEGDLQYFDRKVSSGKSKQGVLVFQVNDSFQLDKASLIVTKDGKQATMALK